MTDKRIYMILRFYRHKDIPLPVYRIAPNFQLRNGDIVEANAFYEVYKFFEEFLQLNYIQHIPNETYQQKNTIDETINAFQTDYASMFTKMGWGFQYSTGPSQPE